MLLFTVSHKADVGRCYAINQSAQPTLRTFGTAANQCSWHENSLDCLGKYLSRSRVFPSIFEIRQYLCSINRLRFSSWGHELSKHTKYGYQQTTVIADNTSQIRAKKSAQLALSSVFYDIGGTKIKNMLLSNYLLRFSPVWFERKHSKMVKTLKTWKCQNLADSSILPPWNPLNKVLTCSTCL